MSRPYGAWISPNGEVTDVGHCQHSRYLDRGGADEEGWVSVVYGTITHRESAPSYFCARVNPETVGEVALKALLKLVNDSDKVEFIFEDMWQRSFKDFTLMDSIVDIIKARGIIRDIAAGKVKQVD